MNPPHPDQLETDLRGLTTWPGGDEGLWRSALTAAQEQQPPMGWRRFMSLPLPKPVLAAAALVLVVGVSALVMTTSRVYDRAGPRPAMSVASEPAPDQEHYFGVQSGRRAGIVASQPPPPDSMAGASPLVLDPQPADRHVVRKATIELQSEDVRAAAAKAMHLVSEAGGEYVENSSITGDGKSAQANLTLRVGAARLGRVLNELRQLGEVKSELTTGEDVTSQAVDLEARLRNEQRIEKELLELLDKRPDAPLKEILELRSTLAEVREKIERIVAQSDRLGRLVSLASILIVIRAEPEDAKPAALPSISDYFLKSIDSAWRTGLRALADTAAFIVWLTVGGLFWWLAIGLAAIAIIRYRRRLAARCV